MMQLKARVDICESPGTVHILLVPHLPGMLMIQYKPRNINSSRQISLVINTAMTIALQKSTQEQDRVRAKRL